MTDWEMTDWDAFTLYFALSNEGHSSLAPAPALFDAALASGRISKQEHAYLIEWMKR